VVAISQKHPAKFAASQLAMPSLSFPFLSVYFITATAPFVLALLPKVHAGTQTLPCRTCFLAYGYNKLRIDAQGHLNAPVKQSEHPSPLSGSLKLSQPSEVLSS
jgi:hypothetical protein